VENTGHSGSFLFFEKFSISVTKEKLFVHLQNYIYVSFRTSIFRIYDFCSVVIKEKTFRTYFKFLYISVQNFGHKNMMGTGVEKF